MDRALFLVLALQCVLSEAVTPIYEVLDNITDGGEHHGNNSEHVGIHLAKWNFAYVQVPLGVSLFILATTVGKVAYHHANFLSSYIPESCILIIVGTLMGVVFYVSDLAHITFFTPKLFFLILLPPIILESAYSLHDRTFADNIGTVLVYAVLGTVLNWFIIGPALYGLSQTDLVDRDISFISAMTFGALIVAVDPVAVLAIFEEIGVNNVLYFLVFGESLLNDAVTVVLYNMMTTFAQMPEIGVTDILLAVGSFFTVSLGGLMVGTVVGLISAFLSRFTNHVRVVEPMVIFIAAYISYLSGELFHFSGIISMIGCGLVQVQYAFHNISQKSRITVKYFSKMQSGLSEAVIFLFLGQALVMEEHEWDTGFVLATLLLCLIARFSVVFGLSFLANKMKRKVRKISIEEQFIMAYGGLRGAVGFSLSVMLNMDFIPEKRLFMTATVTVLLFTCFFQGVTIKPLVKLFRIALKREKTDTMITEMNTHVVDHLMAGVEEVIGSQGKYYLREKWKALDEKYLKPILQREPLTEAEAIMIMYHHIAIEHHILALPGSEVHGKDEDTGNEEGVNREIPRGPLPRQETAKKLTLAMVASDVIRQSRKEKARRQTSPLRQGSRTKGGGDARGKFKALIPRATKPEDLKQKELAIKCLRKWKPDKALHRKYDRNLTMDENQDLETQLRIKSFLTERMSHTFREASSLRRQDATDQGPSRPGSASPQHVTGQGPSRPGSASPQHVTGQGSSRPGSASPEHVTGHVTDHVTTPESPDHVIELQELV